MGSFWHGLVDAAPSERELLEWFFLWVYTPRAHADGTVEAIIEDALAYPHKQSAEAFHAQLTAFAEHSTTARLGAIDAPTLAITGELDRVAPPRFGRAVAKAIPGAQFEVMPGEAHQPFQEVPDAFNDRVSAFWEAIDDQRSTAAVALAQA
jgi:pimeloyl-ACP methyl ester carboxylesterase